MSDSRKFKAWLARIDPQGAFSLSGLIELFAQEVLGMDQSGAEGYAQANKNSRWRDVVSLNDELKRKEAVPLLGDMSDSAQTGIYLASRPHTASVPRERAVRSGMRGRMLRAIDTLDHRSYEVLACLVAKYAGAERVQLTPRGNEGGIDFFALIRNPGRCHVFSQSRSPIRVIGQCKKYESSVGVDKVREFVQSINSVCHQSQQVEKHVPPWFRSATGPVVGWVIAHRGFQSGAITLANNHGIILSDSLDFAEICTQSRKSPFAYGPYPEDYAPSLQDALEQREPGPVAAVG